MQVNDHSHDMIDQSDDNRAMVEATRVLFASRLVCGTESDCPRMQRNDFTSSGPVVDAFEDIMRAITLQLPRMKKS
jgi:hypothetical protein